MKKIIAVLMATILLLCLAACGSKAGSESNEGPIAVDEGLFTMEITIPSNFFDDQTAEEIKADAEEKGYLECTVHEDGSVTYKMTRAKHQEMLKEFKASIDETIADLVSGDEKVESFLSIDYNEDLSKVDIFVDPETHTSLDNLYVLTFFLSGAYYQSFAGVDGDKIDIIVNFIDNNTKEVLDTASYKTFISNLQESENDTTEEAE